MIVSLDEIKEYLKIDSTDEDTLLTTFEAGAEMYLTNATGNTYDSTNPLAKLYCLCLIDDWYKYRSYTLDFANGAVNEKVRYTLNSIGLQLKYTPPPVTTTEGDSNV